ncbi:MAG TPA: hypothetical protein VI197_10120 [Polyangiaceae bacterium]
MGDKLKPGGLGLSVHDGGTTGVPSAFADSMAQAMEDALNDLLSQEGKPTLPTDNSTEARDRRMLFVAIARGIVSHLTENEDAFSIRDDDDDELNQHHVRIASE